MEINTAVGAMPTAANLTNRTINALKTSFDAYGHTLTPTQWDALEEAIDTMTRMATHSAKAFTYVSALDPGIGKSQALLHFVREWSRTPELASTSLLICVPRLEQMKEFVSNAGLDAGDIAVITPDKAASQLSSTPPDQARVLVITHAMFERRSRGRALSLIEDFTYLGEPRTGRVWDESLMPGRPITLGIDDILELFKPLRRPFRALVERLEKVVDEIRQVPNDGVYWLPQLDEELSLDLFRVKERLQNLSDGRVATLEDLFELFGKSVSVKMDRAFGNTALTYKNTLPEDITPILVLDASARVRSYYSDWEVASQGRIKLLGSATKSYRKVEFHVWKRGGGKSTWQDKVDAEKIAIMFAETILQRPDEDWLVIYHKQNSPAEATRLKVVNLPETLRKSLPPEVYSRIKFVTWGNHTASNDYSHIPNVIVAGPHHKRDSYYEAVNRMGRQFPPENGPITREERQVTELSEVIHDLLQGVSRCAARRCKDGEAAPARVWMLAPLRVFEALETAFPGAVIREWKPNVSPLRKGSAAAKTLAFLGGQREREEVSITEALAAIEMANTRPNRRNFRSRVISDELMKRHLELVGWTVSEDETKFMKTGS